MLPTSEFLFWFKVESRGLSCQAFIGLLVPDIINLAYRFVYSTLVITNSFRSLGSAVVILMFSKPELKWVYCFIRGLRPEIRDHVILQLPSFLECPLNFAKLKELVTLSRKSSSGHEDKTLKNYSLSPQKTISNKL